MTGIFGDGIPIPDVIDPAESMEMTLCIPKNRDHMAAFFGALYQLTMWNSWQQDGTEHGKELAAVWWRYYLSWNRNMNNLECEDGMGNCCTEPVITQRINPTTGQVEQSTNSGATWTPAASALQAMIVQPVPPVTSGVAGTKCDAATNLSQTIDVWIEQGTSNFDTVVTLLEFSLAVIAAVIGAVLVVVTGGGFTPVEIQLIAIMGAALGAVWAAGKTNWVAYWTEGKKHTILCAAFCTIGDDGSFTDAQFSDFWNRCNTQLSHGPAKMLFMGFLSSVGKAGINAMSASGISTASDCSDCECTECNADLWTVAAGNVIFRDSCTIVVTPREADHRIALTTGSSAICGYYDISDGASLNGVWLCGEPGSTPNVNTRTTLNWNYDSGNYTNGVEYTITFHNVPF